MEGSNREHVLKTLKYPPSMSLFVRGAHWARSIAAGSNDSWYMSVSVAPDGSVYAAGSISGTGPFDFGNNVTAQGTYGSWNLVLVKYNKSGLAQWARTKTGGNGVSQYNSVSVASDGSVYAVGVIAGTGIYDFGNSVTAAGTFAGANIVLVKYDSTGLAQWARTAMEEGDESWFNGVCAASDGSVYAAGSISGNGPFNFGNSVAAAGTGGIIHSVLVKYDSAGVAQWARTVTTSTNQEMWFSSWFDSVSVASDGSVYAAGTIYGPGPFNFGNNVTAAGWSLHDNLVLVKYTNAGVAQWAQTMTAGSNDSWFSDVSVASDGSIYAAGSISGTGPFDFGNNVTAQGTYGDQNLVLIKYRSSGVAQWARTKTGGRDVSQFNSVSAAPDGSVYAVGVIAGTGIYDFGNSVTAAGTFAGANIVLVKYDSTGVEHWARTVTAGSDKSWFNGVSAASDGSVYAAGSISGNGPFNFGNNVAAAGTYTGYNIVLVKYGPRLRRGHIPYPRSAE